MTSYIYIFCIEQKREKRLILVSDESSIKIEDRIDDCTDEVEGEERESERKKRNKESNEGYVDDLPQEGTHTRYIIVVSFLSSFPLLFPIIMMMICCVI